MIRIQLLFVLTIWIMLVIRLLHTYFKLTEEQQGKFNRELKSRNILICVGSLVIGSLLGFTGLILAIKWIQHSGAALVLFSWFMISFVIWRKGNTHFIKSIALFILGILGLVAYSTLLK